MRSSISCSSWHFTDFFWETLKIFWVLFSLSVFLVVIMLLPPFICLRILLAIYLFLLHLSYAYLLPLLNPWLECLDPPPLNNFEFNLIGSGSSSLSYLNDEPSWCRLICQPGSLPTSLPHRLHTFCFLLTVLLFIFIVYLNLIIII